MAVGVGVGGEVAAVGGERHGRDGALVPVDGLGREQRAVTTRPRHGAQRCNRKHMSTGTSRNPLRKAEGEQCRQEELNPTWRCLTSCVSGPVTHGTRAQHREQPSSRHPKRENTVETSAQVGLRHVLLNTMTIPPKSSNSCLVSKTELNRHRNAIPAKLSFYAKAVCQVHAHALGNSRSAKAGCDSRSSPAAPITGTPEHGDRLRTAARAGRRE